MHVGTSSPTGRNLLARAEAKIPQSDEKLCRSPPPRKGRGKPKLRDLVSKTAYFGAWILLVSIVTASRARALPDRLAAVFIVMLE